MKESGINWRLLAERLYMARRRHDMLTQEALAGRAGTSRVTISRLERANKPQVSADVLCRIADQLHCSLDWLTGRSDVGAERAETFPVERP